MIEILTILLLATAVLVTAVRVNVAGMEHQVLAPLLILAAMVLYFLAPATVPEEAKEPEKSVISPALPPAPPANSAANKPPPRKFADRIPPERSHDTRVISSAPPAKTANKSVDRIPAERSTESSVTTVNNAPRPILIDTAVLAEGLGFPDDEYRELEAINGLLADGNYEDAQRRAHAAWASNGMKKTWQAQERAAQFSFLQAQAHLAQGFNELASRQFKLAAASFVKYRNIHRHRARVFAALADVQDNRSDMDQLGGAEFLFGQKYLTEVTILYIVRAITRRHSDDQERLAYYREKIGINVAMLKIKSPDTAMRLEGLISASGL